MSPFLMLAVPLLVASRAVAGEVGGGAGPGGGPLVTYLGFVRSDGIPLPIFDMTPEQQPVYRLAANSGFYLVVEGRPGPLQSPVGMSTFNPVGLPDLQVQVNRTMGNGSTAVCDKYPPSAGGVPGTSPPDPNFSAGDAVNDLACRFTTELCVEDPVDGPRFVNPSSTIQFCALIGPELAFRTGGSLVTARLRDLDGMVGPISQTLVLAGPNPPSPTPTRTGGATPSPSPDSPATETSTATATASPTPSPTIIPLETPTPTSTPTPPATPTETSAPTPTPSQTLTVDPSPSPTRTLAATPTATLTATPTATGSPGAPIDLESLIHALFSPTPPPEADVNEDLRVSAPDIPALLVAMADV